jgi:hypothetical protein
MVSPVAGAGKQIVDVPPAARFNCVEVVVGRFQ